MKTLLTMALLLLFTLGMETSFAKDENAKKTQGKTRSKTQGKLGTSFRFDGSNLHGKYQTSPSTTAVVEDDKFMEDLLGARKHFNDRIRKDQSRN